jgi:hypothetical protein
VREVSATKEHSLPPARTYLATSSGTFMFGQRTVANCAKRTFGPQSWASLDGHNETLRSLTQTGLSARLFKQSNARLVKNRHQFCRNDEQFERIDPNIHDCTVACPGATCSIGAFRAGAQSVWDR